MPRYPRHAASAEGLSDQVFGQLVQKSQTHGGKVYPLHVGDTYLEPLPAARAEAQKTSERVRLHNYAPVQGEPELLDAILGKVQRRSGVALQRDCVQVMAGATAGLGVICAALLEPGDEVLLPAPFWPLIRGAVKLRGARAVEVPFYTELNAPGFDPVRALEQAITDRTVAIYLNSPHNPTGVGAARADRRADRRAGRAPRSLGADRRGLRRPVVRPRRRPRSGRARSCAIARSPPTACRRHTGWPARASASATARPRSCR